MKKLFCLALSFLLLSACQITSDYPAGPVLMSAETLVPEQEVVKGLRHKGRVNYSAVEAVENEEDAICIGAWCGCPME